MPVTRAIMVTKSSWQISRAPAKVNLSLKVVGRRADGYHLLDSIVVFSNFGDHLALKPTLSAPTLRIRGPFASNLESSPENNLAFLADRAFVEAFGGTRCDIRLWKRLPTAAGIGGGSADAAAVLRLKAKLAGIPLNDTDLNMVALSLGADVPMCLRGRSARVGGIGETLIEAPIMPALPSVLVNPAVMLPTPSVFKLRSGPFSTSTTLPEAWNDLCEVSEVVNELGNDLMQAAIHIEPVIKEVLSNLKAMAGLNVASMSGSGATCFGLFDDLKSARQAAHVLKRRWPGWWVAEMVLNP